MTYHRRMAAICLAAALIAAPFLSAQMSSQTSSAQPGSQEALPSPPAETSVMLNGKKVTIHYNSPYMRGRKIMGGLVPYGHVWRTGANPATSFTTETDLKLGNDTVPAGSYTLYTQPSESTWTLIINKQTGQWGTVYDGSKDLVHVPMKKATLAYPQEKMSISFANTQGSTTELHIRWETTDVSVTVTAQ